MWAAFKKRILKKQINKRQQSEKEFYQMAKECLDGVNGIPNIARRATVPSMIKVLEELEGPDA